MTVRSCERSEGTGVVKRNYPTLPAYYSHSLNEKKQNPHNSVIWFPSPSLFPVCQHYGIDLTLWLMSWKLHTLRFSHRSDWPTGDLNPNNVLQASRDREEGFSFPCGALRTASFLTAPADENKGNCILKQRPSHNPHNSCCLWCKYFREVSWPHSMAKAINNHKKYEPPPQWLIACALHNALFAVSFKQFTISGPNCQSNQGCFKVIFCPRINSYSTVICVQAQRWSQNVIIPRAARL